MKKNIPIDKVIPELAGFGVPVLILITAISVSGYAGAAAISTALCALGPGGMVGGIITLISSGILLRVVSEWGVDYVFSKVLKQMYSQGETKDNIFKKIEKYPLSKGMRLKLHEMIEKADSED